MEQLPRSLIHGGRRIDVPRILRRYRLWVVAGVFVLIAIGVSLAALAFLRGAHDVPSTALEISSTPADATVEVDGRKRGQTPLTLALAAHDHTIVLHRAGYADAPYDVSLTTGVTTTLHADLWLRSPHLQRLRPALPGASIHHADFLADGRVILVLSLPPSDERQAWVVAGSSQIDRLGPANVQGSLAVSPDAQQVAYLARSDKAGVTSRLDEVWIAAAQGDKRERRYSLPATASGESLVDVAWSGHGAGLLLISRQGLNGGGVRTVLRWLDVGSGEVRDLVNLPSEVVAGSFLWSPSGKWTAFLAQAGSLSSLCLLEIETGRLRYLADVQASDTHPLPAPPLAWSPNGDAILYAASAQESAKQSGWLLGAKPKPALFLGSLADPVGQRLGDVEGYFPVWRSDGSLLAFTGTGGKGALTLRAISAAGTARDVGEVQLDAATYAVRWDAVRAQALLAVRPRGSWSTTETEYWLARWTDEEAR